MKNHSGAGRSYSDTVKSPVYKKTPLASNTQKRGLSVSPEVVDTNKTMLRSNKNNNRKTKT